MWKRRKSCCVSWGLFESTDSCLSSHRDRRTAAEKRLPSVSTLSTGGAPVQLMPESQLSLKRGQTAPGPASSLAEAGPELCIEKYIIICEWLVVFCAQTKVSRNMFRYVSCLICLEYNVSQVPSVLTSMSKKCCRNFTIPHFHTQTNQTLSESLRFFAEIY